MTCRYSEINPLDALYIAARKYPGSVEGLAQRLGVSANVLRNKLRSAIETHHAALEDFSAILDCLEEAKVSEWELPLQALCWRHRYVAVKLPDLAVSGAELFQQVLNMLRMLRREGELAGHISEALSDNVVDARELELIERGLQGCITSLVTIRDQIRAKHDQDAGKAARS